MHPPHDACDAVNGNHGAIRNFFNRFVHTQNPGYTAFASKGRKMRGAAATLGHHSRYALQNVRERRPRRFRNEYVARRYALELAFAVHDTRATRTPTHAGGMAIQAWMVHPDIVRHL